MTNEEVVYQAVRDGELEIDDEGRIWRVASRCGAGKGRSVLVLVPRKRAEHPHPCGYWFIGRKSKGVTKQVLAHRLVWFHLYGEIPPLLTINHIDGIKTNNRPDNLELATHTEQALHALHVIHTRVPTAGERSWTAKLTERDVESLRRRVAAGERQKDLAEEFGVDPSSISNAVHGKTWTEGAPSFVRTRRRKMTPAELDEARRLLSSGTKGRRVAEKFGISPAAVSRLKNGTTWKATAGLPAVAVPVPAA